MQGAYAGTCCQKPTPEQGGAVEGVAFLDGQQKTTNRGSKGTRDACRQAVQLEQSRTTWLVAADRGVCCHLKIVCLLITSASCTECTQNTRPTFIVKHVHILQDCQSNHTDLLQCRCQHSLCGQHHCGSTLRACGKPWLLACSHTCAADQ